jgi:hypothetical protein
MNNIFIIHNNTDIVNINASNMAWFAKSLFEEEEYKKQNPAEAGIAFGGVVVKLPTSREPEEALAFHSRLLQYIRSQNTSRCLS